MGRKSFWHVENRLAREVVVENHLRTLGRKSIQAVENASKFTSGSNFTWLKKAISPGSAERFTPPITPAVGENSTQNPQVPEKYWCPGAD